MPSEMLPWCKGACSAAAALIAECMHLHKAPAFSMCNGWWYRVLQVGHKACAAGCVTKDLRAAADVSVNQ